LRTVLATDFGIWPVFTDMAQISDAMVSSNAQWSALANYILLYDQIIIPTGNLQILPVLRIMLGEGIFDELIRNNVIVLARYDTWFTYAGNGSGLVFFRTLKDPSKDKNPPNLLHSYFTQLDEAIDTALVRTLPVASHKRKIELTNLLLDKVVPIDSKVALKSFREETYKDVLGSPYLQDFFSIRNRGRGLNHLRGIKADQMLIFDPNSPPEINLSPEIWSLLRVAFENFVLSIGTDTGVSEITGDGSTLALLKAKGQRVGAAIEGREAFTQIQEISGVPNIGQAFAEKRFSAEQLLDLRESKHAQAFRNWIGSGSESEKATEIVNRYIESIGKPSLIDNIPSKVIRFAATTGIGALEPISGFIAGAIDSFLLNKWFPDKSPRLFLKQAKSMQLRSKPKQETVLPPKMSGRDRNRPCSCGSGKKFKYCCGQ
jgi:hypothetical protein